MLTEKKKKWHIKKIISNVGLFVEHPFLKEVESLLDELLANAEELNSVSAHDISPVGLKELQKKQMELIGKLKKIDLSSENFEKLTQEEVHRLQRIKKKLRQFATKNEHFFKNIQGSHEIIDFN